MTYYRRVRLTSEAINDELYQLRLWELELRERLALIEENDRLKKPCLRCLVQRKVEAVI